MRSRRRQQDGRGSSLMICGDCTHWWLSYSRGPVMSASSKLRRVCKVINAAAGHVLARGATSIRLREGHLSSYLRYLPTLLDLLAAYIILHLVSYRDHLAFTQPQSRPTEAKWWSEPPPRTRSSSVVPKRWILRSTRSGAGQVRDAPASAHRGPREDRGSCPVRCITSNALSSRSRLRTGRLERFNPQDARPQRRTQAHRRRHALHRAQACRRRSPRRSRTGATDQGRTRPDHSPPQYRTRFGAQKKTIVSASPLPADAISIYETLRADVLQGLARADGLGAVIYHGMIEGLAILMIPAVPRVTHQSRRATSVDAGDDHMFLHVMANMILQAQSEVKHVY